MQKRYDAEEKRWVSLCRGIEDSSSLALGMGLYCKIYWPVDVWPESRMQRGGRPRKLTLACI